MQLLSDCLTLRSNNQHLKFKLDRNIRLWLELKQACGQSRQCPEIDILPHSTCLFMPAHSWHLPHWESQTKEQGQHIRQPPSCCDPYISYH